MISNQTTPEQDRQIMQVARYVLDYLAGQAGPVPSLTLLAEVAARHNVPEALVGTAVSRVADKLVWDYTRGPLYLSLQEGGSRS